MTELAGPPPLVLSRTVESASDVDVLTAYEFDKRRGTQIDDWTDVLSHLSKDQVLWVDVVDPSEPEERAVWDGFELGDSDGLRIADSDTKPTLDQNEGHIRVTAVAVSDDEKDPARELVVLDCFVGSNWVITTHAGKIAVIAVSRLAEVSLALWTHRPSSHRCSGGWWRATRGRSTRSRPRSRSSMSTFCTTLGRTPRRRSQSWSRCEFQYRP